ncbi:unnamed protein product [Moneuplotes crassus]|uniref:Uncharacterized protein n=1 Tax=Euplotes crassus TaxID=5936 RepID=A0AAD1UPY7_EUPCR|nr:unnamed protein product [Moneuplotes crassus]
MESGKRCQVCSEIKPGFCIRRKGFDICEICVREIQPKVKEGDDLEGDFKRYEDTSLKGRSLLYNVQAKSLLASASGSIRECLLHLNKEEDRENFIWYLQRLTLVNKQLVDIKALCFQNQHEEITFQNNETEEEIKKINKKEKKETQRQPSFKLNKDSFLQRAAQKKVRKRELRTLRTCQKVSNDAIIAKYPKFLKSQDSNQKEMSYFRPERKDMIMCELCVVPLSAVFSLIEIHLTENNEKQTNSFFKILKYCNLGALLLLHRYQNRRITPFFQDLLKISSSVLKKLELHRLDLTRMQFVKTLKVFKNLPEMLFVSCKFILQCPIYLSNALEGCKISKLGFKGCESDTNCAWGSNSDELDTFIETLSSSEHLKKSCKTFIFEEEFTRKMYAIIELKLNGFKLVDA